MIISYIICVALGLVVGYIFGREEWFLDSEKTIFQTIKNASTIEPKRNDIINAKNSTSIAKDEN